MHDILKPLIKQFMPFAQKEMGFDRPPKLFLRQDSQNADDPLGKTGFYDPKNESITIFTSGRHPKDVMRSLAHELMHHAQKCNGDFDNVENMGEQGYAQSNSHLRTMEIQAYQASIVFRDWEDSIKGTIYNESLQKGANENMSIENWKNKELKTLLTEKWGFKMDLGVLSEASDTKETEEVPEEEEEEKENLPPWLKKSKEDPEVQEEGFDKPKSATGAGPSNKGGKTDRSDVANKADPKLGRSSNRGQKKSAGGTQAPPKAGRIDRTDVANKAPAEWLKEAEEGADPEHCTTKTEWKHGPKREWDDSGKAAFEKCMSKAPEGPAIREVQIFNGATEICKQRHDLLGDKAVRGCIEEEMTRMMNEGFGEGTPADDEWSEKKDIYEMCPHEDEGGGMEIDLPMGVEMGSPEEGGNDVAALATQAMAAIHKLAAAAGVEMDTTVGSGGDDEELEEISKRKDDPRNARAKEWPDRMREALKTRGLDLTERQLQHVLRKALELQKR